MQEMVSATGQDREKRLDLYSYFKQVNQQTKYMMMVFRHWTKQPKTESSEKRKANEVSPTVAKLTA